MGFAALRWNPLAPMAWIEKSGEFLVKTMSTTQTAPLHGRPTDHDLPTPLTAPGVQAAACPECDAPISASPVMAGELVDCSDCGLELEAISLSPLRFAAAPEIEEDWGE